MSIIQAGGETKRWTNKSLDEDPKHISLHNNQRFGIITAIEFGSVVSFGWLVNDCMDENFVRK